MEETKDKKIGEKIIQQCVPIKLMFSGGSVFIDKLFLLSNFGYPAFHECSDTSFDFTKISIKLTERNIKSFIEYIYNFEDNLWIRSANVAEMLSYLNFKRQITVDLKSIEDKRILDRGIYDRKFLYKNMLNKIFINSMDNEIESKIVPLCSIIHEIPSGELLKHIKTNRKHAMIVINYCFARDYPIIEKIVKILTVEELRECISTINSFKKTKNKWKTNRIDLITKEISTREK
jgi:hypothetical protein